MQIRPPPTNVALMEMSADLGFKPLYQRVRERLTQRIMDGTWIAGNMVPSEMQIAAELGVSQGTVRKALDEMTAANLLVRRQGRGTFVATHDESRILFQFFKLQLDGGARIFPESEVLGVETYAATQKEADKLGLFLNEPVIRIHRVRSLDGKRCISEMIVLPAALFEGIEQGDVPNNLYDSYARRFGVTVGGGVETLKATAATQKEAQDLGLPQGHPLLLIDRVATAIDGRPVEWRVSLCNTAHMQYVTELR
ncbi:MAG: GntR family transcriptional regulator [Beijerinckiaceae bacterium]